MKNINQIITILSLFFLCLIYYNQKKQIKKIKDNYLITKTELDSLKLEIFAKDIQITRYEYIMDMLDSQLDIDCKNKIEEIKFKSE